jgi:hypothetical protein
MVRSAAGLHHHPAHGTVGEPAFELGACQTTRAFDDAQFESATAS